MCLSQQFTKKTECISFLQKRREILFGVLCCCCFPSCGGHQHCRQLFLEQTGKRGGGREGGREAHRQSTLAKPGSWSTVAGFNTAQQQVEVVAEKTLHTDTSCGPGEVWLWQEMGRNRTTRSQLLGCCFNCFHL